jgi:PAS domain S-box-containing protein
LAASLLGHIIRIELFSTWGMLFNSLVHHVSYAVMATANAPPDSAASEASDPRLPRLSYKRWRLSGIAGLCGLLLSLALFWTLWHEEREAASLQFRLDAGKKVEAIKQAVANQLGVMSLFRAFYAGSVEVDRGEFNTFSASVFEDHPGIKTLAWMPRVRADQRSAFEAEVRKSGFPEFRITQLSGDNLVAAGERNEYYPILFIEPQGKNRDMMGFDIGSLPDCRAAMERAEGSRPPAISYSRIPGLDEGSHNTINMFDDARNEPSASAADKKSAIPTDGFILGTFQLSDVIKSALRVLPPVGVDNDVFDVTDPNNPLPVISFPSRLRVTPLPALASPPPGLSDAFDCEIRLTVGDRTWLAYCRPTDVYFSGKQRWQPEAVLLGGLLVTGSIVGYLFLLTQRTAQVEKLVSERTRQLQASEKRFRLLVENAADGFFLHDLDGNVLDCNKQACEQLGYSREELMQMNAFDYEIGLKPEQQHEWIRGLPPSAFPVDINGIHRRKDGSTFPVEVRLNYLEMAGHAFLMAVSRDVTDRKQAEEALRKEQRFLRHLIDLQERERKLMAYEIHDGLAQQLTGALFKLQGLEAAQQKQDSATVQKLLDEVLRMIRESVSEARHLISGLRPPILDDAGIVAAIEYLCSERRQNGQSQIEFAHQVQFHRLSAPLEVALFRITQECLTNACRHSQSPSIRVELSRSEHSVRLMVQDWGVGFDPDEIKGQRFGLRGIRERVRLLGGTADIQSAPGKGTTVAVELPMVEGDVDEDEE